MPKISEKLKPLLEEKIRSVIIEAIIEVIIEEGIEGVKTSKIAQKAGVSIGTIYNYFKDKNDMIRQIILQNVRKIKKENLLIIQEDLPVKERLEKVVSSVFSSISKEKKLHRALICSIPSSIPMFDNKDEITKSFQENLDLLIALIQEGIDKKEYEVENATFMALALRGAMKEFALLMMQEGIPNDAEKNAHFLVTCLFK